jgi:diaminopimelate epimerase
VTFLEKRGEDQFATTTFERGVEDFTLSCGTGVLSAAATGLEKSNVEIKKATVESPGGRLKVEFGKSWRGAALQGPAVHVFDGRVPERFLK